MSFEIAKRNRLRGKFSFTPRDWRVELDELVDAPRVPFRDGLPRSVATVWRRETGDQRRPTVDDAEADAS